MITKLRSPERSGSSSHNSSMSPVRNGTGTITTYYSGGQKAENE